MSLDVVHYWTGDNVGGNVHILFRITWQSSSLPCLFCVAFSIGGSIMNKLSALVGPAGSWKPGTLGEVDGKMHHNWWSLCLPTRNSSQDAPSSTAPAKQLQILLFEKISRAGGGRRELPLLPDSPATLFIGQDCVWARGCKGQHMEHFCHMVKEGESGILYTQNFVHKGTAPGWPESGLAMSLLLYWAYKYERTWTYCDSSVPSGKLGYHLCSTVLFASSKSGKKQARSGGGTLLIFQHWQLPPEMSQCLMFLFSDLL